MLVEAEKLWGIEKAGGRVVFDGYANHRVYAKNARYPGLNMSRCIGGGGIFQPIFLEAIHKSH